MDLDCLVNTEEMGGPIKRDSPDLNNLKVGVTSANSKGRKLAIFSEPGEDSEPFFSLRGNKEV